MVKKEFNKKLKYSNIVSNMTSDGKLIIDDVTTSLSTIKAIIHLLPTKNDIKVDFSFFVFNLSFSVNFISPYF